MAVDVAPRLGLGLVGALFGAGVLAQIVYPLVTGTSRNALTVLIVLTVAVASLCHAALTRGGTAVATLAVVTVCGGFAVEVLGVHTGVPFGRYAYSASLGTSLFGVPLVIGFAWTMLAWPAALVAHRLASTFAARVLLGAWALAVWDLFLDPQMVAAGHWHWSHPAVHLPGVPAVPISDYLGWFAVSLLVSVALQRVLVDTHGDDRWPLAFYVWTWASSTLALAVFLDLGAAALWGFLAMGTVAVPLVRSLAGSR